MGSSATIGAGQQGQTSSATPRSATGPRGRRSRRQRKADFYQAQQDYQAAMRSYKASKKAGRLNEANRFLGEAQSHQQTMQHSRGWFRGRGLATGLRKRRLRLENRALGKAEYKAAMAVGDVGAATKAHRRVVNHTALRQVLGHLGNSGRGGRLKNLAYTSARQAWRDSLKSGHPSAEAYRNLSDNTSWYRVGRRLAKVGRWLTVRRYEKALYKGAKSALKGGRLLESARMLKAMTHSRATRGAWRLSLRQMRGRRLVKRAMKAALREAKTTGDAQSFANHVALVAAFAQERGEALSQRESAAMLNTAGTKGYQLPANFEARLPSMGVLRKSSIAQLSASATALQALSQAQLASLNPTIQAFGQVHAKLAVAYQSMAEGKHAAGFGAAWSQTGQARGALAEARALAAAQLAGQTRSNGKRLRSGKAQRKVRQNAAAFYYQAAGVGSGS